MGADLFEDQAKFPNAEDAFRSCVSQALWDHGHSGYTGTIAEKGGYVVFTLPDGVGFDEVLDLICSNAETELAGLFGAKTAKHLISVFYDKWGPCAAFQDGDYWRFCGMASC